MEFNKLRRGKRLVQKVLNNDKNKENVKDINTNFEDTSIRSQQKTVPFTMTNQQETVSFTVSNQQEIVPFTISNQKDTVTLTMSNQQETIPFTIISNQQEAVPFTISNQQDTDTVTMSNQQETVPFTKISNQQEAVPFTISNQQDTVTLTMSNQQETVPFTKISNQQEAVPLTMSNQQETVPLTLFNQQETVPFIVLTGDTCYTEDFNPNMDTMFDSLPVDYLSPRFVPSPSCQSAILDFQSNNDDYTNDEGCFDIPNTSLSPLPCTSLNVPSNRSLSSSPNTPLNELPLSQECPASPSSSHLATNDTAENSADQVAENVDAIFSESDPNNYNMSEGRKRRKKAEPAKWKRNINKKLRMEGKAYLGFRKVGRTVVQDTPREGRIMKPKCSSNVCLKSKKRHCSLFTEEQRKTIYDRFWSLTWGERKAFVCGSISRVPTKANTTDSVSRRNYSLKYSLNNGQESYQVCREMFINTLGIGYRMVQAWVCDSSHGIPMISKDKNTTQNNNVISQIECLNNFFDNLPKMPSHYNRQNSTKLYLEPVFQTIQEVYKLYKSTCTQALQPAFSRKKFSEVMVQKNISLFNVKKDKCNLCASYETKNIPEEVWKEHTAKKEIARSEKREDIKRAIKGEVILIEVDFQAVKLAPFTHANAFYYKTKLACHNSTIYDVVKKQATCYWFSEDQNNQLVASTFVSCLIDYLEKKCLTSEKKPVVIISDGCTAQNCNNIMANALLNFSMLHGVFIYQKYLEVGHTQMEVDSVHACIERKLKNKEIKLPSDYVSTTREARQHPTPYEAIELTYDFFKDYTKPLRYNSIRPGRTKNDPMVTDIKLIMYDPSGVIRVKLDFTKDWMDLPHRPKRQNPVDCYPPLFTARCRIPKTKWLHLQELKAVIPQDCHNFYDNLPYQE